MEKITPGIVLKQEDRGEADKLITLFTPDGVITAVMRGVKKTKAKLKFGALPFAFMEYTLSVKGGNYTVTGCTVEESFFNVWTDVNKYSASQIVLEALDKLSETGVSEVKNLVTAVRVLEEINYSSVTPYLYATYFLVSLLPQHGINVSEEDLPLKIARLLVGFYNASVEELETLELSLNDVIQSLTYLNLIYRERIGEKLNALLEALKILNSMI